MIKIIETPLKEGEMGQAHRDGTIEIDPSLSPMDKKKTIAHEKQHVKDMQRAGLDYDDDFIYFKGVKYERKDGKIKFNGKWLKEGDPNLPWEKRAEKAEAEVESPLDNVRRGRTTRRKTQEQKDAEAAERKAELDAIREGEKIGWGDIAKDVGGAIPYVGGALAAGSLASDAKKAITGTPEESEEILSAAAVPGEVANVAAAGTDAADVYGKAGKALKGVKVAKYGSKLGKVLGSDAAKKAYGVIGKAGGAIAGLGAAKGLYDAADKYNQKMVQEMTPEEYENYRKTGSTTGRRRAKKQTDNSKASSTVDNVTRWLGFGDEEESPVNKNGTDNLKKLKEAEKAARKARMDYEEKYSKYIEPEKKGRFGHDIEYATMSGAPVPGTGDFTMGGTTYRPRFVGYTGDLPEPDTSEAPAEYHAAKDWIKRWEEDPITLKKDMEGTGVSEAEYWNALESQQKAGYTRSPNTSDVAGKYYPRGWEEEDKAHTVGYNPYFAGEEKYPGYGKEAVLAHEFAHAGRDVQRGAQLKGILGDIEGGEYVNRPHEQYGFLTQLRRTLDLKPGQDITPEMIQERIEAGDRNPILKAAAEKLIEANRKVAMQEAQKQAELKALYSDQNTGWS